MSDIEKTNEVLALLGSSYRVRPGYMISEGMMAIVEALPAYVDRLVADAVDKKFGTATALPPNTHLVNK